MESKQLDTARRKRSPTRPVTSDKSPPCPKLGAAKFNKLLLSPALSYPVSGLPPKGKARSSISPRFKRTLSNASKDKSPCKNQGDVVKTEENYVSKENNYKGDKDIEDVDAELVNKNNDFLKLPRRALIRCPNDWEDTPAMCDDAVPKCEMEKGSAKEAPQSIHEIFNDIIQSLVIDKGESPVRHSTSMPGCCGSTDFPIDNNTNHGELVLSDDENSDSDNEKDNQNLVVGSIGKDDIIFSENLHQNPTDDSASDEPSDFENVDIASNTDITRTLPGSRKDSPTQIRSVLERARQLTRKAIQTVRSRSPTPQGVRETFGSVVQHGKTIVQKSKDAIVSAYCMVPETDDDEIFDSQENIELMYVSELLNEESSSHYEGDVDSEEKEETKSHINSCIESSKQILMESSGEFQTTDSHHQYTSLSNAEESYDTESMACFQSRDSRVEFHRNEIEIQNQVEMETEQAKSFNSLEFVDEQKDVDKTVKNVEIENAFDDFPPIGGIDKEKSHEEDLTNEDNCRSKEIKTDVLLDSHDTEVQLENELKSKNATDADIQCVPQPPVAELKFPFRDDDKIFILKSSLSDVPFDDVTESEDMPRKTISLMTSNEADQDRDITEVIALISDEVSLKRYASVNDLTELEKEVERSRSLTFSSSGKNRRAQLNNRVLERGNIFVTDGKGSKENAIAVGLENTPEKDDADMENKHIMNVLDPSYDTDDDQRSSDLSSCDEMSSQSGSQKKTSSSLTTPPNSPRLGIQTETVGTIVSLFETTSILSASTSHDDELVRRTASSSDYHTLKIEPCYHNLINESSLNDHPNAGKIIEEYKENNFDEAFLQITRLDCERNQDLDDSINRIECERNTMKDPGNRMEKDCNPCLDIEELVAALPSPPNTEVQEDEAFRPEGITNYDASTSREVDCKFMDDGTNIAILRQALQKDSSSIEHPEGSGTCEFINSEQSIDGQMLYSTKSDRKSIKEDKNYVSEITENELKKASDISSESCLCGNLSTAAQSDNDDSRMVYESTLIHFPKVNEKSDVCSVDIEVNRQIIEDGTGGEVEGLEIQNIVNSSQGNKIETRGNEMDNCKLDDGDSLESTCAIVVDEMFECDAWKRSHATDQANMQENFSDINLSTLEPKSDHSTETLVREEFRDENLDVNLEKQIDSLDSIPSNDEVENQPSSPQTDTTYVNDELRELRENECTGESSGLRKSLNNITGFPQSAQGSTTKMLPYSKPNYIDDDACSSSSTLLETSHNEQSESICPILVPTSMAHDNRRPSRAARITWALEDEIIENEASGCSSQSDREEEEDEDEMGSKLNAYDRCNSCQTKNLTMSQPLLESKRDEKIRARGGGTHKNDDILIGNSSKMAQFILYTGALLPSPSLDTGCSTASVSIDKHNSCTTDASNQVDNSILQNKKETALNIGKYIGNGDTIFHPCPVNKNLNSEGIVSVTVIEDGNVIASSPIISNPNSIGKDFDTPIKKTPTIMSSTLKPNNNNVPKSTYYSYPTYSYPVQKSHSLDSANQMKQEDWYKSKHDAPQMISNQQTSPLSAQSWSLSQQASEVFCPISSISDLKDTFENTCNFLDRMSERIESNLAGIRKTSSYIDRTQRHLSRCDQLIVRSSKTLQKSAQLSAKVRDQVKRVDLFLASGKLASPRSATCK